MRVRAPQQAVGVQPASVSGAASAVIISKVLNPRYLASYSFPFKLFGNRELFSPCFSCSSDQLVTCYIFFVQFACSARIVLAYGLRLLAVRWNRMAMAMKPGKVGVEEAIETVHRIRITLSSKSVKNLEKGEFHFFIARDYLIPRSLK